jgi:SAM-dependent methyltransferase
MNKTTMKNPLEYIRALKKRCGPLRGPRGIGDPPPVIRDVDGYPLHTLKDEFRQWELVGMPLQELQTYLHEDFLRFVYTLTLVPRQTGRLLELGACPYFTTRLLKLTRQYDLLLANYFGPMPETEGVHQAIHKHHQQQETFRFQLFNCEQEEFPYQTADIDVVLFCEILEHLLQDPAHTLSEINRILKPGGICILTTPNVNRFENLRKLLIGENIYDQYSGHGPYGRHNREYTLDEVQRLFTLHGFAIETRFTADVWPRHAPRPPDALDIILRLLTRRRKHDLGEYLFIKAQKIEPCRPKRSIVFYRSYADLLRDV